MRRHPVTIGQTPAFITSAVDDSAGGEAGSRSETWNREKAADP